MKLSQAGLAVILLFSVSLQSAQAQEKKRGFWGSIGHALKSIVKKDKPVTLPEGWDSHLSPPPAPAAIDENMAGDTPDAPPPVLGGDDTPPPPPPAQGPVSDVFKLLPTLQDTRGEDIKGIQERVRANIEKRIPKGNDPRTWDKLVDEQVTLISQYLAALHVTPEDLEQPAKLTKAEKDALKRVNENQREAAAKQQTRAKKAQARIAANAAIVLADDSGEDEEEDDDVKKGVDPEDEESGDAGDPRPSKLKLFSRLLDSSLQFLSCPDLTDWACLQRTPIMTPKAVYRRESRQFGAPVPAGQSLDMEWYFNEHYDNKVTGRRGIFLQEADPQFRPLLTSHLQSIATQNPSRWAFTAENGLATRLDQIAAFIPKNAVTRLLDPKMFSGIDFALYGIDDVEQGKSMNGVYNGLLSFRAPGRQVRGVVDITTAPSRVPDRADGAATWLLSYIKPTRGLGSWFFGTPADNAANFNGAIFQYNGTASLISDMNWNDSQHPARTEEDSRVRVEWTTGGIMHNKYIVFKQGGRPAAVWTGTANFSGHCMGEETNSNISVVIKNPAIAATYQAEFEHMFNFFPSTKASKKIRGTGAANMIGRFHHSKVPVAPRLFTFTDGTNVAVHFAPTDDGEHRSVLPMIHSANAGDTLRISMFGNSGYEYIRAIQLAVARGVNVRIVLDSQQGAGSFSWLKDPSGNLMELNPYMDPLCKADIKPGTLSIKVSNWDGKNHYKAGTLTRKTGIVEAMIVGSQNWSNGGNDGNDENMVSIQNKRTGVRMGRQFNLEFEHLAEASRPAFNPNRNAPQFPPSCAKFFQARR